MQFLVDTLTFKVTSLDGKNIFDFLHLNDSLIDWQDSGCFNVNYANSLRYQGIIIGYNGTQYEYCIHLSGIGCRTYEDLRGKDFDWYDFLAFLNNIDTVVFTRIDIACDEREGYLNIRNLERCIEKGAYASKCKSIRLTKFSEECCYIGSSSSDCFLRIYNKKLERGYSPDELDGLPWNRAEFQLRDERAINFIADWLSTGDLGYCFISHCNTHIRFLTKPNDHKNSQRIPTANFWKKFIAGAGRLKWTTEPGSEYNLSRCAKVVKYQAGSSIVTYVKAKNLSPEELWNEFVEQNDVKLRPDQIALIKKMRGSEYDY